MYYSFCYVSIQTNKNMLSVNIPVYNVEITDLVLQLRNQAEKLEIPYEIRIYDDGSQVWFKEQNRKIAGLSNVIYSELEKNVGRAVIRNQMGHDSAFQYLLFIDADSKLVSDNYLASYREHVRENVVLCGGTVYSSQKPADPQKLLRWYYGTSREAVPAGKRNLKKGFIITSNNFLIERRVFEQIRFRENIRDYGHEDTLLGYDLFMANVEICHICNPVEHSGLEDAEIFLQKTRTALKNLRFINEMILAGDKVFMDKVHFLNRYRQISRIVSPAILRLFFRLFSRRLERNLTGQHPRLFLFDLYKLCVYAGLNKVQENT